jgi:glycosyltransferase involved in cell wall biosynthesis
MKVDLYFGKKSNKMFGINRVKLELYKHLPEIIEKKAVYFTPNNRVSNYLDFLTHAPLTVFRKRRKQAIGHILSQSEAHLLNVLRFKKSVVLCYDIIPLVLPYASTASKIKARIAYTGMKRATHIIAISKFTKSELIKHLKIPPNKITVIYIGVDHNLYKPIKNTQEVRIKYNLSEKNSYLIYVGNEEPRMNLKTLLHALKKLKEKHPNLKLIKGGNSNFPRARDRLLKRIKTLGLQDDVIFTGYINEKDLPHLYNIADVCVYLSDYAGFGLPAAEAMACGTPTIGANSGSVPEAIGDGGILVNAKDSTQVAVEIDKILSNESLRNELRKKGIEQSQKFTWESFAKKTVDVYKKLHTS